MKTIILGMGNTLLRDDGIGIIVKRYLEEKITTDCIPDSSILSFAETSWGGFGIIDILKDYDYAIVIDSIKHTGEKKASVGHIHHFQAGDLLHTLRLNSYHDINFITAIKIADSMGYKIPNTIDILAVEIENNYTICENLTDIIRKAVGECSKKVIELLVKKNVLDGTKINYENFETVVENETLKKYYQLDFQPVEYSI